MSLDPGVFILPSKFPLILGVPGVGNHEIHEFPALEKSGPPAVALPLRNQDCHFPSEPPVPPGQFGRVLFEGNQLVNITVDMKDRNALVSKGL